jgi:hypothetical protein
MATTLKFKIRGKHILDLKIEEQSSMHFLVTAELASGFTQGTFLLQNPNTTDPSDLDFKLDEANNILTFE